jgi:hypothetical protein
MDLAPSFPDDFAAPLLLSALGIIILMVLTTLRRLTHSMSFLPLPEPVA